MLCITTKALNLWYIKPMVPGKIVARNALLNFVAKCTITDFENFMYLDYKVHADSNTLKIFKHKFES